MKKLWNKLEKLSPIEFAEKFNKKEPKLEDWHKENIAKCLSFIEDGGKLTFRKGRKK